MPCKPGMPRSRLLRRVFVSVSRSWRNCGSGFATAAAVPRTPTREQCNRQMRPQHAALVAFFLPLVALLTAQRWAYEALDSSGGPPRDAKRRGAGWLPGLADSGWSNRLGWYAGFQLVLAVTPVGGVTGFGLGAASPKDHPLAETFFVLRRHPPRA